MRKLKFVSVFVLLALCFSVGRSAVLGQEETPQKVLSITLPAGESNYGKLTLQYPVEWKVETTIEQTVPFSNPSAIIRRETFTGPGGGIDLDVWPARGRKLGEWLDWYTKTRYEIPITRPNATVGGHPAAVFVEGGGIKLLTAFVSDGKYVYRLWYTISSEKGLQTYWQMLDTFAWSKENAAFMQTPQSVKESARQALGTIDSCSIESDGCSEIYYQGCCGHYSWYCTRYFPCSRKNGGDLVNCTYWACSKMSWVPFRGDAWKWWYQVPDYDFMARSIMPPTDRASIVWWDMWDPPAGVHGHVAYLPSSYSGGAYLHVSEMDWCYTCDRNISYHISSPGGFIYFD